MMKNIILVITLLMLLGCKKQNQEIKLKDSQIRDINQIVEAIIIQDSLYISKRDKKPIAFCTDLVKINIQIPIKNKEKLNEPPIPFNSVSINELLNFNLNKESFFLSTDSTYLISQNPGQKKFRIAQDIVAKINATTIEKITSKGTAEEKYSFYEMTIPIFSRDNTKAYLQLNYNCGALCGNGTEFFLSKINGKWRIINKSKTWIS